MLEPLPIDFNEAAHRYQWQPTGEWLAHSVTQIKGASMADSQRAALDRTKHIWEPRGKTVHSALEAHLLGLGPVGLEPLGLAIRHSKILYRHPRFDEGFICERDYKRFMAIQRDVFRYSLRIARTYKRLKREYRDNYITMVSDASWNARFKG